MGFTEDGKIRHEKPIENPAAIQKIEKRTEIWGYLVTPMDDRGQYYLLTIPDEESTEEDQRKNAFRVNRDDLDAGKVRVGSVTAGSDYGEYKSLAHLIKESVVGAGYTTVILNESHKIDRPVELGIADYKDTSGPPKKKYSDDDDDDDDDLMGLEFY